MMKVGSFYYFAKKMCTGLLKVLFSSKINLTILLNRSPTHPKDKAKTMAQLQKKKEILLKMTNFFLYPKYISSIY